MVTIAEKINAVLAQRRMLKRDLARALGVAPQTATDICKGRSAVTLPHLRKLCETFGLRPDYWLDESTLEPGPGDRLAPDQQQRLAGVVEAGLLEIGDAGTFARQLIELAREHRAEWVRRFGAPAADVADLLGVPAEHRRAEPAPQTEASSTITPMSAQVDRAPTAVGHAPGED
ncbi:MAG: helix-turn-helix domain-containing protein [Planctomycetota bacterium]|jgi:transcriptional regulator with XRE-family HTH domain